MQTATYTVAVGTRDTTVPSFESVIDSILRLGSCKKACISIQPPERVTIAVYGGTEALRPANGEPGAALGIEGSKQRLPQGLDWSCSIHLQPGEGLSQLSQPPVLLATCSRCKESNASCSAADTVSFLSQHSTHNTAWAQQLQHEPELSQQLDQLLTQLQQHGKQHPKSLLQIQRTAALICVEVAYLLLRSPVFNSSKWLVNLSNAILYHRVMWFVTNCFRPAQVQPQQLGLAQQQLRDPNLLWLLVGAPPYCQSALVIDPTLKHWSLEASCLVALLHRCQLLPIAAPQTQQGQQGVAGPTPEQQVVAAVSQLLLLLQGSSAGPPGTLGTLAAATWQAPTADIDKPFVEGLLQLRGLSLQDLVAAAWPNSVDTQLDTCVICGEDFDPPEEQLIECITCCHSYHLSCVTDPQNAGVSYTPAATAAAKGGRCLGCQGFPLVAAAAGGAGSSSSRSPRKGLPWGSAEKASGRFATSAQRRLSHTPLPPQMTRPAAKAKGKKNEAPSLGNTTSTVVDAVGGARVTAAAAAAGDSSSSNSGDLQIVKRRKCRESSQAAAAATGGAEWPCQLAGAAPARKLRSAEVEASAGEATQGAVDALQQLATAANAAAPARHKAQQQQQQQQARLSALRNAHPAAAATAAAGAAAGPAVVPAGSQFTGQSVAAILQSLQGDVTSAAAAAGGGGGAAAIRGSGATPGLANSATVPGSAGKIEGGRSGTRQQALAAAAAALAGDGIELAPVSGDPAAAAAAGGGDDYDGEAVPAGGDVLELPNGLRMRRFGDQQLLSDAAASEPAGAAAHTTATLQKRKRGPEETAQQQQQRHGGQQQQHQQQKHRQPRRPVLQAMVAAEQHRQQRQQQQHPQDERQQQQQPQLQQQPRHQDQRQQEQADQRPQLLQPAAQPHQHPQPHQRQRQAGSSDASVDTSPAGGTTLPAVLDGSPAEPTNSDARSSKRQKTVDPQATSQQQQTAKQQQHQQQTAKQGSSTAAGLNSGQQQSADQQQGLQRQEATNNQQHCPQLQKQQVWQRPQQAPVQLPGSKQQQPGAAAAARNPQQAAAAAGQSQLRGRQELLKQQQAGATVTNDLHRTVVPRTAAVRQQQQVQPKQSQHAAQQPVAAGNQRSPAAALQVPRQQPAGSKQQQLQTEVQEYGQTLQGQQLQRADIPSPPQQQTPQQTAPTAAGVGTPHQQQQQQAPDRQKPKRKMTTPSHSPAALSPADQAVLVHNAKLRWQLIAVPDVSMRRHLEGLLQTPDVAEQQVVDQFIKFWVPGQPVAAAAAAGGGAVGAAAAATPLLVPAQAPAAAGVPAPAAAGACAGTSSGVVPAAAAIAGRGTSVTAAVVDDHDQGWDWAALQDHNVPKELLQLMKAAAASTVPKQQVAELLRLCSRVIRHAYGMSGGAAARSSAAAGAAAACSAGRLEAIPVTGGARTTAAAAAAAAGCSTDRGNRAASGQPGSNTAAVGAQLPRSMLPGLLQSVRQLLAATSCSGAAACSSFWKIATAAVERAYVSVLRPSTRPGTRGEAAAGGLIVNDLQCAVTVTALVHQLSGSLRSTTWDLLWKVVRKDVRKDQQQQLQGEHVGEGPPVSSVPSQWPFALAAVLKQIAEAPSAWEGVLSVPYESTMQQRGASALPAAAAAVRGTCSKQQTLVKLLYEYYKVTLFSVLALQQAGQQIGQGTYQPRQQGAEALSEAEMERVSARRLIPAFEAAVLAFSACLKALGPAQQQPGQQERQRLDQQSHMLPELLVLLLVLIDMQLQALLLSDEQLQDVLLMAGPGVQGSLVDHTVGMVNKVAELLRDFHGSPRTAGAAASSTAARTAASALGCEGSTECRCRYHAVAQECRYLAESLELTLECVRLGAGFTNRTGSS